MSTKEAIMTTQDIANRFYELSQSNNWSQIQEELFSDEAESIEPQHSNNPQKQVKGRAALDEKSKHFQERLEEMFGGYSGKPIVAGRYFAVAMGLDAKMKDFGRIKMDEIALYEVDNGKIVKEQFFF